MTIPTFNELFQSVSADLRNRMQLTTIVGKNILNAFALVLSAKLKLVYLHISFIYKNIFPDTADPESLQGTLNRFGYVKLKRYQNTATAGEYTVEVNGEIGAVIPPNTTFKSLDTSKNPDYLFILDSTFTFAAETENITLRALTAGTESKLEIDDQLQLTQPLVDVNSYATVKGITTEPIEAEDIETYRSAILERFRTEPQGGSKTDYRRWSRDVSGLREVYPITIEAGIVQFKVEALPENSTDGYGTPDISMLNALANIYIFDPDTSLSNDQRARRPIGLYDYSFAAITLLNVDVEITGLSDTSYLTAIENAIKAYLYNVRPYVAGADPANAINKGYMYEGDIYSIIRSVIAPTATFTLVVLKLDSSPVSSYQFQSGQIPRLNSVTG